ncbi:60S ribosomal protein L29-like [Lontra canadensis]|uniref:60S ribosomal protein L29-like n=1 Tax=Lontra canadensis TaxID=76717 RepID=UPI0013F39F20|nr:60S ribosomal protein L29-like [Lontra canadensis]
MCFAKKLNKKGLKEMQADTAKAMSTCAKAIGALIKPNEINARSQNVVPQARLTCRCHSPQAQERCSCSSRQGSQALLAKGQGSKQSQGLVVAPAQAPKDVYGPRKAAV